MFSTIIAEIMRDVSHPGVFVSLLNFSGRAEGWLGFSQFWVAIVIGGLRIVLSVESIP